GVFEEGAQDVKADYQPETVSVDGRAATHQAWQALSPLVALPRCFPHGRLNVRSRGKLDEAFAESSKKAWEASDAPTRGSFAQRVRRLWEWAQADVKGAWSLERVEKGCKRGQGYGEAYPHPGGHRTSDVPD